MIEERAIELWSEFMALFENQRVTFLTNQSVYPGAWTPATFDAGILVIGNSKTGCLWVEEED